MKFFLSTARGFITGHLCKRLIELGHEVDAVGISNVIGVRPVDSFQLRTNKYDYCIHLAATTSIKPGFNQGIWFNNAVYAEMIMNNPFRTVYASSTSAYEMTNVYAHSKAFLEVLGERHGNAIGLRFFNCYGSGNNKGIVKRVIDCCLSGETLTLQGGDQIRDFIYIDDVVDIIIDHLDNPLQVMDVGTGVGTKIIEVVADTWQLCFSSGITRKSFNDIVKLIPSDYAGEQMESIAHSHPIKEYTPLREGIRKTIEETLKPIK